MSIGFGLAVYFVIWWTVLFAILPLGITSQHETGEVIEGTDPGAPVAPKLLRKAIQTTVAASIVFAGFYVWMVYG